MKFFGVKNNPTDHEEINKKLDEHERKLARMARRLRNLEIEAGLYKPPLRKVQ